MRPTPPSTHHRRSHRRLLTSGVLLSLVCGASLLRPTGGRVASVDVGASGAVVARTELSVVEPGRAPTVRLRAATCSGREIGTGVVLGDGTVLTARHVVDGAATVLVEVDADASVHRGRVVAVGRGGRDLALVRVDDAITGPRASFAARPPRPGEEVAVSGHAVGGPLVTTLGRVVAVVTDRPLGDDGGPMLVTTASVRAGMSGGPVIDADGRLVGLAIGAEEASDTALAVPLDDLRRFVAGGGERPTAC